MIKVFGVVIAAFMLVAVVGCKKDTAVSTLPDEIAEAGKTVTEFEKTDIECETISPFEAKEVLSKNPNVILIDVRDEDDYLEKHIVGAISIPKDYIVEKAPEILPNKDAVILLYCLKGIKSKEACEILSAMGYTNVRGMGGINDYSYETQSGNGNE